MTTLSTPENLATVAAKLVGADLANFRATLARLTAVRPGAAQQVAGTRAPSVAATAAVLGKIQG